MKAKIKFFTQKHLVEYKSKFSAGFDIRALVESYTLSNGEGNKEVLYYNHKGLHITLEEVFDYYRKNTFPEELHTRLIKLYNKNTNININNDFCIIKDVVKCFIEDEFITKLTKYNHEYEKEKHEFNSNSENVGELYIEFYNWIKRNHKNEFEGRLILPFETGIIFTGLFSEIKPGYEVQIRGRSGLNIKQHFEVMLGTIDSDYRGEWGIIFHNQSNNIFFVGNGDRIAQGVLNKLPRKNHKLKYVESLYNLKDSERGTNGFGSTGIK